ncbi:glycosyltransferase family 4 protein [Pararhizobium sp. LjRoot238]|uniref:glycosyltransferase family 4 protein n=1 Tax=Pararhizobium sp. LjRoot238 TaxID=3342293 RepID=UPI003F501C03
MFGRVDVLHINLSSHGSTRRKIIVARWARLLGIPYVVHLHGSRFRQFWNESPPGPAGAIARMFASATRIVVLGNVWKSFVAEKVPGTGGRIVIIPNATPRPNLPRMKDEAGQLRILFLGRVGVRKGVPQLVEALSMVQSDGSWRATIAGDGDVEETRQEIERLGLSDHVTLPGWVGPNDVAELLSRSDVLVLPSFDENLPMSVIEGMAAGLAIIATPVGAVEDIIADRDTGLLVPVGDSKAIAASIQLLLEQPQLRKTLGENARRRHAERLEIGMYFDRLVDLWTRKNIL